MKKLLTSRAELIFYPDRVIKRSSIEPHKLDAEVRWLKALPPQIASYFPAVLSHQSGAVQTKYEMTRGLGQNLAERLLGGALDVESARTVLRQIYEILTEHWFWVPKGSALFEQFSQNYIQKIRTRYAPFRNTDPINRILNASTISLNGVQCRGAVRIIEEIEGSCHIKKMLNAPHLSHFHGDFKLDNIVVDEPYEAFLIVDPRGATPSGNIYSDPVEDFAKMRTSTLAGYDLIKARLFTIDLADASVTWSWTASRTLQRALAELDLDLLQWVERYARSANDPHALLRLRYITSLLLIANAPFQIVADTLEEREFAVMLVSIGTLLLNTAHRRTVESRRGGGAG